MNGYGNSKNDEELILMMEQMQDELEDMRAELIQKDEMIADLQKRLQTSVPSSAVLILKNKIQEQSDEIVNLNGTISSQNEWIGKMSESDLIVKDNERLKEENRELIRQKELSVKNAERRIASVKNEYADAIQSANEREQSAKEKQDYYNNLISGENKKINQLAEKKISKKISALNKSYKHSADANKAFWGMMACYSVISTLLLALKDKPFAGDFMDFLLWIENGITEYVKGFSGGTGNVITMLIGTVFCLGLMVVTFYLYIRFIRENEVNICDGITSFYLYLSLAIIMFSGEIIKEFTNINLIGLYILLLVMYFLVRPVIQMKDKEERNNLVVNVVAAVLIVAIIMLGLRSCSKELANLR